MKSVKLFVLVGAVVSVLACGGKVQDTDARTSDADEESIDSESMDDSVAGGGSVTMPTEAVGGFPASSGTSSGGHVTAIEAGAAGSPEESGGSGVGGKATIPETGVGGSVIGVGGATSVGGSDAFAGETSTAGSVGEGGDVGNGGTISSAGEASMAGSAGVGGSAIDVPVPMLVASLTASTPESRIVVPGVDPVIISEYVVMNEGDAIGNIDSVTIRQPLETGSISDCARIDVIVDDVVCNSVIPSGVAQDILISVSSDCPTEIRPTGSRVLRLLCTPADPSTEGTEHPMSGDAFRIKVSSITSQGILGRVEGGEPNTVVLRKSAPIIEWIQPTEVLHEGVMNTIATLRISAQGGPVGLQQIELIATASLADVLTDRAVETRLLLQDTKSGETVTWEWSGEGDPAMRDGFSTDVGVFYWEEEVPDTAYSARLVLRRDRVIYPDAPLTISLEALVSNAASGVSITTRITRRDQGEGSWTETYVLSGFGGNGIYAIRSEADEWPYLLSGMWWTDFSAGESHHPLDLSGGFTDPFLVSSRDYILPPHVVGISDMSIVSSATTLTY